MHRNGQNSTSREIFNPKFEISMGSFLFEYEFWWLFRQDLYVFWTKNGFCNAEFSEFGGWWEWGWPFFDETPKRHILGWFHAFWDIMRADPFARFVARRLDEKKGTLQKVTDRLYFTYLRGIPHSTKFSQNWHLSRGRRRNQPYQVWWRSVQGVQSCGGSNFVLLHRNGLSPITL